MTRPLHSVNRWPDAQKFLPPSWMASRASLSAECMGKQRHQQWPRMFSKREDLNLPTTLEPRFRFSGRTPGGTPRGSIWWLRGMKATGRSFITGRVILSCSTSNRSTSTTIPIWPPSTRSSTSFSLRLQEMSTTGRTMRELLESAPIMSGRYPWERGPIAVTGSRGLRGRILQHALPFSGATSSWGMSPLGSREHTMPTTPFWSSPLRRISVCRSE